MHVLEFLETLRHKLKDRTDKYKELFADNDIDGVVLLGLTADKLEKARYPLRRGIDGHCQLACVLSC